MTPLRVGSCFAGGGGIDLGLEAAGVGETIWHSEVSKPALRVLAARWPNAVAHGDITTMLDGLFAPEPVDLVAGGPPCQNISKGNAYTRHGLAGIKSGLFFAWARVIQETEPRWIVMEQVTGLASSGATRGA